MSKLNLEQKKGGRTNDRATDEFVDDFVSHAISHNCGRDFYS